MCLNSVPDSINRLINVNLRKRIPQAKNPCKVEVLLLISGGEVAIQFEAL